MIDFINLGTAVQVWLGSGYLAYWGLMPDSAESYV
jgi:hypothetical protein